MGRNLNYFTVAPLPNTVDLLKCYLKPLPNDDQLSRSWVYDNNYSYWYSRSSWSLLALVLLRSKIYDLKPTVMIPNYFCNSSLLLLRRFGAKLIFYPITQSLKIDREVCEKILNEENPDLFLYVHYFGYAFEKSEWLETICTLKKIWLIEDATHVLKPTANIGQIGDAILYSPHKILPIPDGAILVICKNGPNQFSKQNNKIKQLIDINHSLHKMSKNFRISNLTWILKRLLQNLGVRNVYKKESFYSSKPLSSNYQKYSQISNLSKRLLKLLLPKLDQIVEQRTINHEKWVELFRSELFLLNESIISFDNENKSQIPYQAFFLGKTPDIAERIYDLLNKINIPVTT